MLRPENVEKNLNWIGYPMPVHGTEEIYDGIIAEYPECKVTIEDLARNLLLHHRQRRGPRPAMRRTPRSRSG